MSDEPTEAVRPRAGLGRVAGGRHAGLATDPTPLAIAGDGPDTREASGARRASSEEEKLEPGAVVGRYVVLQTLGVGGMGVVYAGYDPELDRKIAVKVMLPGAAGPSGRARLLREAQTLAKLSHPNVVAIHDVGTAGEQVWIAMEFVQGQTLGRWLAAPRTWREVLAVMLAAGEGVAAAHSAGLLHRDFKPDNVMVGDDGRVRVMDFGLARVQPTAMLESDEAPRSLQPTIDVASLQVTHGGAIMGTPGYMAPEQYGGAELTAAVDQFAFCVTLWEALYGERPFSGETYMQIVAQVVGGKLRPPPRGRAVPSWLRRACERGLAVDPGQRWPSMHALLDVLATGRARARLRKGLVALGGLVLLGAGVAGQQRWDLAQRTAACEASGDEIETAWSDPRRQALRDALFTTGTSQAATVAEKAIPWLDAQAEAWRAARVEACTSADVHGTWDADTLDRARWCLEERRMELQALVDELTLADAVVLQKAVPAAASLVPIDRCRDARWLEALPLPPRDQREAIQAVRDDLARAESLLRAGHYARAVEHARDALARAEALGWPPLTASARQQLGTALVSQGAYAEAETVLEDAYFEADLGVAPHVALQTAIALVDVVGDGMARYGEARRWARQAESALAQGPSDTLDRARLLVYQGYIEQASGDHERAKERYDAAVALRREALGPGHPDVAGALQDLAGAYRLAGDYDRARALYEEALAIYREAMGPEHPHVAGPLVNLAAIALDRGRHAETKALSAQAVAIYERTLGPDHPHTGIALNNLAPALFSMGALAEAIATQERVVSILSDTLGPEHPDVATSLNNLGRYQEADGARERAAALYRQALAIREKALGPDHPNVATSLECLASLARLAGDLAEAEALQRRAVSIREQALGPDHPDLGDTLLGLALIARAQSRPVDAAQLAERALALMEKGGLSAEHLAEARFVLAWARWEAPPDGGRDRTHAVALAQQARDALRGAGAGHEVRLAEVEAWLAEHHAP